MNKPMYFNENHRKKEEILISMMFVKELFLSLSEDMSFPAWKEG